LREIQSEKRGQVAIVSIIFLLGIFFGINFTNMDNFFTNDAQQSRANEILTETRPLEPQEEFNLFQNDILDEKQSTGELITLALEEINADRLEHGLTPVKLGNNRAAQFHAEDMMDFEYFSHWNTNGVKPYVPYTENGGRANVKENIATSWCEGISCKMNPAELIKKLQHLMVYDDAESNWGHRDNILDPDHSLVNIGLAWNDNNFYFAQHFETKIIDFNEINLDGDNILEISGTMADEYTLKSITVFQDDRPLSLNGHDLESNSPYDQNFYNRGILAGILINEPKLLEFYEECQKDKILISSNSQEWCVPYATFGKINGKNKIDISVDMSNLLNPNSIHTIYINLENHKGDNVVATSITLEYL